jgi:uncharacterized membrane protein YvlD (DUF360 family)
MGLLATIATPIERLLETLPLYQTILLGFFAFIALAILLNVARQVLLKDKNLPPEVFSFFPVLGSTYVCPTPMLRAQRVVFANLATQSMVRHGSL